MDASIGKIELLEKRNESCENENLQQNPSNVTLAERKQLKKEHDNFFNFSN